MSRYGDAFSRPAARVTVPASDPLWIALTAPARWLPDQPSGSATGASVGPPTAGVREPGRPKPGLPGGSVALAEPRAEPAHRPRPAPSAHWDGEPELGRFAGGRADPQAQHLLGAIAVNAERRTSVSDVSTVRRLEASTSSTTRSALANNPAASPRFRWSQILHGLSSRCLTAPDSISRLTPTPRSRPTGIARIARCSVAALTQPSRP